LNGRVWLLVWLAQALISKPVSANKHQHNSSCSKKRLARDKGL
jgi:hypothetical protein